MPARTQYFAVNKKIMSQNLTRLLLLSMVFILVGCSLRTVTAGEGGIRVRAGGWVGKSDDSDFMIQFSIGSGGSSIIVIYYAYPCGEMVSYVLSSKTTRIELINSTFEGSIETTDLGPRVTVTGRFIDKTHVEGTWESSGYSSYAPEIFCPAASGTWKGGPE